MTAILLIVLVYALVILLAGLIFGGAVGAIYYRLRRAARNIVERTP